MKNEDASDLFGDSLEDVDFHESGNDTQQNHSIDSEDREIMMNNLLAQDSHLSVRKAKALVDRYF